MLGENRVPDPLRSLVPHGVAQDRTRFVTVGGYDKPFESWPIGTGVSEELTVCISGYT